MKKFYTQITAIVLLVCTILIFNACDFNPEGGGGNQDIIKKEPILATDYDIPDSFAMTIQIPDSAIFNPGAPWYYKTAKIGNDWQLIEYDRDLADLTKQETHFFEYISDNNYQWYKYDYDVSSWIEQEEVDFEEMIALSPQNFVFLYKKPSEPQIEVEESNTQYDIDPTSIENMIDAVLYEYHDGFDIEVIVDADYLDTRLSKREYVSGNTLITRAYEYTNELTSWGTSYMQYKYYKERP